MAFSAKEVLHLYGVDPCPQAHGMSAAEDDSQQRSQGGLIVTVDTNLGVSQTLDEGHHLPCHQMDLIFSS